MSHNTALQNFGEKLHVQLQSLAQVEDELAQYVSQSGLEVRERISQVGKALPPELIGRFSTLHEIQSRILGAKKLLQEASGVLSKFNGGI